MQIDRRPLFDRLAVFPRLGLANLPTPIEPMPRLTIRLGGPRLWATTISEIEPQAARSGFASTAVVHCTRNAGTQAGLVVGAAVAMPNTRIVGIDIDARALLIGQGRWRTDEDVVFLHTGGALALSPTRAHSGI